MKKKIYINGRFLSQSLTGVQRFAIEIVRALDGLVWPEGLEIILLLPVSATNIPSLKRIKTKIVGKLSGALWEQLELPFFSKGGFLVNLGNTAPLLTNSQFLVVHDMGVYSIPEAFSFGFRVWYKVMYAFLKLQNVTFGTVSRFSLGEIERYLGFESDRVFLMSEGKEHIDRIEGDDRILERFMLADTQYVLAVSSLKINKNFKIIAKLIEDMADLNIKFVIAGGTNSKVFAKQSELPSSIIQVGYVTDSELKSLYENASCFIFPSTYEGFGIPPLEAMACGCPVISSNATSIPEVCGDAALYFEPNSAFELKVQLLKLFDDDSLRVAMKARGLLQASSFSWEENSYKLLEFINKNYYH